MSYDADYRAEYALSSKRLRQLTEARALLREALAALKESHGAWNLDTCERDDCGCPLCARVRAVLKGGA